MPNIRTYDAGVIGARPTETGIEARAATARRIGTFYNQEAGATQALGKEVEQLAGTEQRTLTAFGHGIGSGIEAAGGEAAKYITHRELSQGARDYTGMVAGLEKEWQDELNKVTDPNDPSVAARFRAERLEPEIEKFKATFLTTGGQRFAEGHTDQFRTHMFTRTTADMSSLAKIAAADNIHKMTNNLSVAVMANPDGLDFALRTLDGAVAAQIDSSPTLRGVDAAHARSAISTKSKEEVVKAAAFGYILRTGEVPGWVSDPKYAPYLKATELKQFEAMSLREQRLQRQEESRQREETKRFALEDFRRTATQMRFEMMPEEEGGRPRVPADFKQRMERLMSHPAAAEHEGAALWHSLQREAEVITNRMNKPKVPEGRSVATEYSLNTRLMSDDDIPSREEVLGEYNAGNLTEPALRRMLKAVTEVKAPGEESLRQERNKFFIAISKTIEPGERTPAGQQQITRAINDARFQEQALRDQKINPRLLYREGEHYFGTPANIRQYVVTPQEGIRSAVDFNKRFLGEPTGDTTPPVIKDKAEYELLPKGTKYRWHLDPPGMAPRTKTEEPPRRR